MSASTYDEPFLIALSVSPAPPTEDEKGVSYVKWGTEVIGWVRKIDSGQWAWWASDGRSVLDVETDGFSGESSRLLAAIDLLRYVATTRGQERNWKRDAGTLAGAVLGLFDRMGKPGDLAELAQYAKDVAAGKQEEGP